jgi:8-oxo-dGTP pyrophosphatase MutT (NUDIX family)
MNTSQDKQPARDYKKVCHFRYLPPNTLFSPDRVTSVGVVPFTEDGEIVVVHLDRWWDIMGGHVQEWEYDFEEVARREALEEACIRIKDLKLSLIVESDYFGSHTEDLTYMFFYSASVDVMGVFVPNHESFGRKTISTEEFLRDYEGNRDLARSILISCMKVDSPNANMSWQIL